MRKVRQVILRVRELNLDLFEGTRPSVFVTLAGEVLIDSVERPVETVDGQLLAREKIDVLAPFLTHEGARSGPRGTAASFAHHAAQALGCAPRRGYARGDAGHPGARIARLLSCCTSEIP
jgi:hypothetical protein